jgi:general stress protein 26
MNEPDRSRTKLWDMIRKYRFAMMTTQEDAETLRSRPMTTIEREYDGSLWFFAKADSAAAAALETHPGVCLSYSDSDEFDFVSVAGEAAVVVDPVRKKELWKPAVQAWFPEGPDSNENVLIKVTPHHAEYWDSASNKLVQLFSMAKALATGKQPRMGEHRTVPVGDAQGVSTPGVAAQGVAAPGGAVHR